MTKYIGKNNQDNQRSVGNNTVTLFHSSNAILIIASVVKMGNNGNIIRTTMIEYCSAQWYRHKDIHSIDQKLYF